MDCDYWDNLAKYFEADVFNVLNNDREGLVVEKLEKYGAKGEKASDIGCGIGSYLPELCSRFKKVLAVDISSKCIARAQEEHSELPNVSFMVADLAASGVQLPKVNFTLSVNSVITPVMEDRNNMLDEICSHLQVGGHLVLVVPSLESAILADLRLIEWNLKNGMTADDAVETCLQIQKQTDNPRLCEGIVLINDVATKHYLKEELIFQLQNRGMETLEIDKIEYPWKTEYIRAPRWMKDPLPWDWLFVARKVN